MYINGDRYTMHELLLASAVDSLNFIAWSKTENASKGKNRPKSIVSIMFGVNSASDITCFSSGDDFTRAREEILRGIDDA